MKADQNMVSADPMGDRLVESCASMRYTCGSNAMTIGVIKQQEHAYEPEAVRLRASRGNRRTNDYISFILDCLAKPFCRDMCNFKINIMSKGLDDKSARSLGT